MPVPPAHVTPVPFSLAPEMTDGPPPVMKKLVLQATLSQALSENSQLCAQDLAT